MQLVERHVIERTDPRFAVIDAAAFASKNLYNVALYLVRQTFIFEYRYLNYHEVQKRMQSHEAYNELAHLAHLHYCGLRRRIGQTNSQGALVDGGPYRAAAWELSSYSLVGAWRLC